MQALRTLLTAGTCLFLFSCRNLELCFVTKNYTDEGKHQVLITARPPFLEPRKEKLSVTLKRPGEAACEKITFLTAKTEASGMVTLLADLASIELFKDKNPVARGTVIDYQHDFVAKDGEKLPKVTVLFDPKESAPPTLSPTMQLRLEQAKVKYRKEQEAMLREMQDGPRQAGEDAGQGAPPAPSKGAQNRKQ